MYYWEIVNKQTGEIKQYGVAYPTVAEATSAAKAFHEGEKEPGVLTVNIFTQSPDDRIGQQVSPIHSEELVTLVPRWYVGVDWGVGMETPTKPFTNLGDAMQYAGTILTSNQDALRARGGQVVIYPGVVD